MNIGLEQVIVFLLMVATGILGGICFDFYRAIRYTTRPKKIATLLGDILFWICWAVILFSILLMINAAQLRSYIFIGLSLGAIFYFWKLSRRNIPLMIGIVKIVQKILLFIQRVLVILFIIIKTPIIIICQIIKVPFAFCARGLRWIKRKIESKIPKPPADPPEFWEEQ